MSNLQRPRIGIIGTGAIGGSYGVMLARAGFNVHFLLCSEFAAVQALAFIDSRNQQLGAL